MLQLKAMAMVQLSDKDVLVLICSCLAYAPIIHLPQSHLRGLEVPLNAITAPSGRGGPRAFGAEGPEGRGQWNGNLSLLNTLRSCITPKGAPTDHKVTTGDAVW